MSDQNLSLQDVLYDKSYTCPVCDHSFKSKAIRVNTNKAESSDIDLCPHYSVINPLLYDAILCPECGYCTLSKNFDRILPTQATWIKEQYTNSYKKRHFGEFTSLEDAIIKHQLALVCAIIKKAKLGEQGYIALHIAWLYRDLNDSQNEHLYLERAYTALSKALQSEHFPLFNLEADTTAYILAAISYILGDYENAKRYLPDVIASAKGQLKERAIDLKHLIGEKMKESV